MLKIAHLTVVRKVSPGQEKQLLWEYQAAKNLDTVHWETIVFQDEPSSAFFVKRIPVFFRSLFLRKLFAWMLALRLSRRNDIVLLRHVLFDPFSFIFAPMISNRVAIHHAKDVDALLVIKRGWRGRCASYLEQFSGRYSVRHALAILAVTKEIAQYQTDRAAVHKPVGVYSNGVSLSKLEIIGDTRVDDEVNVCFLCGKFSVWQGLDKLIKAVENFTTDEIIPKVYIHLIGQLSSQQISHIGGVNSRKVIFRNHGVLTEAEYRPILDNCDFGIASLAIERQGLEEASSLKVREMLALGLAVYSNHEDVALDRSEPFIKIVKDLNIEEMIKFGLSCKSINRSTIRKRSQNRIEKLCAMKTVINFLNEAVL